MDPNDTLAVILRLARIIRSGDYHSNRFDPLNDAEQLAESVFDLDEWLRKGGPLPARWKRE